VSIQRRRRSCDAAAIGDRDPQAGPRQRRGQGKANQAGTDDNDIANIDLGVHASTSIT
jgi:hypothetical protein